MAMTASATRPAFMKRSKDLCLRRSLEFGLALTAVFSPRMTKKQGRFVPCDGKDRRDAASCPRYPPRRRRALPPILLGESRMELPDANRLDCHAQAETRPARVRL